MRVAINCRSFLKENKTGIGRYAFNLVRSLGEIDPDNEYWLYARKRILDFRRRLPRFSSGKFKVKADYFNRGTDAVLRGADVYHSPSLDFIGFTSGKVVVTVHDLIYKVFPQGHTPETRDISERQMREVVRKADHIICCSQATLDDLVRHFPVDKARLSVIHQGVDKGVFFPLRGQALAAARRVVQQKGVDGPFLLFVGTLEPRKNLLHLLEAFERVKARGTFRGRLVVIGMRGWMMEQLQTRLAGMKARADVILPGFVTDEELRCFYNCADVFIFPSFYEGFGFPVLEAFCCGAPVITSRGSACGEVAAGAAEMIDPESPAEISEAIRRIVHDEGCRQRLKAAALKRAEDFSFRKTAEETLRVYQRVFKGKGGHPSCFSRGIPKDKELQ
ncbi:MAG TPA: glycosyltransferase family 1 protein [Candidatus Omnitrophota bacterium]|mgnify:CR=1 FL=1|jgi:glycosyltransferase involved in cell wall biosynthesis|nr:glycosyltransferase family 1 protein [Candidatus Omnitrophota bacterium]HPN55899.1 glycosyltransferase family 1 protein [Candidatus Omnitrophota bacterium]